MCYAKPGPRCSAHARERLRVTTLEYDSDPTLDNFSKLQDASFQFNMTPAGQQLLLTKIQWSRDKEKRAILQQEYDHAVTSRRLALLSIKAEDVGDFLTEDEVASRDSRVSKEELKSALGVGMEFEHATKTDYADRPVQFRVTMIRGGIVYYRDIKGMSPRGHCQSDEMSNFIRKITKSSSSSKKEPSLKLTPAESKEIFDDAYLAGRNAANSTVPTPMIVEQHAHPLDDSSPVIYREVVNQGPCGFAWVRVKPGNSSFARWAVKEGLARSSSEGGVVFWIGEHGQSYELKSAHAGAMSKRLRDIGIDAMPGSRLD